MPEGPAGCTSAINDFEQYELGITTYPNPTAGLFNVELPASLKPYSYKVIDALGNIVKTGLLFSNKNQINCTELLNGAYFIIISQNTTTVNRKIIIQK